jgi:four helix bundle protein
MGVPAEIKSDSLWKMKAYRLSLFISDLAWEDAGVLLREPRTRSTADQLYRAASNISSNFCEGYSRGTGKGRALFYEYAVGSARETRDFYYKGRRAFSPKVVTHRIALITTIIRLGITMMDQQRTTNRRASAQN